MTKLAASSETSTPISHPGDNNNVPHSLAALLNPDEGPDGWAKDVDNGRKHAASATQSLENLSPDAHTPSILLPIPEKTKKLPNGNEKEMTEAAKQLSLKLGSRKRPAPNKDVQIWKVAKIATGDVSSGQRRKPRMKTAIWERLQNLKYEGGEATGTASSAARFQSQILKLDKYAVIEDPKSVRHFKCGKTLTMKYPFNPRNFETHIAICQGPPKSSKLPGGGMMQINSFFKPAAKLPLVGTDTQAPRINVACPGLDAQKYTEVESYLDRTGALGGGASSVTKISFELYGKKYIQLSPKRKIQVKTTQRHDWAWRNEHDMGKVFSKMCTKIASTPLPAPLYAENSSMASTDPQPEPCLACRTVLMSKAFKNACSVPRPDDDNYKYINFEYRSSRLAALMGRCLQLREIIEDKVNFLKRFILYKALHMLTINN